MKIWQRPIVGHVQITLISAYQIQKLESSQSCLYVAIWLAGEISCYENYKGRMHMYMTY